MTMHKISEVVIVEGRYDKNTLLQCVDCTVIETSGFGLFNNKEKAALLNRLAKTRGIIVFTDSDSAGFLIRNHIKGIVPSGVKHAYIPDIYGREKRKRSPSKEGKLGVEGMSPEIIIDALRKAGATFIGEIAENVSKELITKTDFFELGLTGCADSSQRRAELLKKLELPERMTANALLEVVNILYDKSDFIAVCQELFPQ